MKLYGVEKKKKTREEKKKLKKKNNNNEMEGVEKLILLKKWEVEVLIFLSSCVVRNARDEILFIFCSFRITGSSSTWPCVSELHKSLAQLSISPYMSIL